MMSAGSKAMNWTGRVISTLVVLFMLLDGGMKVMKVPMVIKESAKFGLTENDVVGIGVAALVSALLYAIPLTSILGAILLTGYLGGAIATQVVTHQPAFGIVFASAIGVLVWLGIFLREPRLRQLIPLRAA